MQTLPSLTEILDTLHVVQLPMTTQFRSVTMREVALFEGPEGWTEFSAFLEYEDKEAASWLAAAIEYGWQSLPKFTREQIETNATLPAVKPEQVHQVLQRFGDFSTVKIKVAERGQQLQDDLERIKEVRRLYPDVKIRVDANGGWNLDEAIIAFDAFGFADLEYVEQPCASVEELAALRKKGFDIPIAADESIRKADDPYRVVAAEAADIMVIKVQPLGGISACLDLVEKFNIPAVVSSALESSIGLGMSVALAASMKQLPFANGIGTSSLFSEDVTSESERRRPHHGMLTPARLSPDETQLQRLAANHDRYHWWQQRISRCYEILERRLP